jgi:NAD-dependent DNA ligase
MKAGAILHDHLESCEILVLDSRSSDDFIRAYDENKIIGTSYWIKSMLSQQIYIDPLSSLLFYPPQSHNGILGLHDLSITITNYTGTAREIIQLMCERIGLLVSATMTRETTHLICAHPVGVKYEKAIEWNIHGLNTQLI